jgi:pimeloyl-ACP methyl ester carboxylesterase
MNAICSHLDTIELTELARTAEPGEDWSRRPQQLRADRRERPWHLDWERMTRPGNIDAQFALFRDYANHVARFDELAAYHRAHPPPAHVLGGRRDAYFDVDEVLAYHRALERVEAHIYDGGHLLLETHSAECAELMRAFVLDNT